MFNWEDELIIEHRASWLIWIQLIVVFLIFALYCLTVFAFDFSKTDGDSTGTVTTPALASSSTSRFGSDRARRDKNLHPKQNITIESNCSRNTQVDNDERSIKGEIATGTSRRITQVGEGTVVVGEGSEETKLYLHPCTYFRLAKSAFLRCLGLDSSTDTSISDERKRQESRKSKES